MQCLALKMRCGGCWWSSTRSLRPSATAPSLQFVGGVDTVAGRVNTSRGLPVSGLHNSPERGRASEGTHATAVDTEGCGARTALTE
jgi:hypothetical protein